MPNSSVDRISTGLDRLEREKSGATVPLARLAGAPASVSDLNKLASGADLKAKRLSDLIKGVETVLTRYEDDRRAYWAEAGKITMEGGISQQTISDSQKRRLLKDELRAERKRVLAVSHDDRAKIISELSDIKAKVAAVSSMWSDPVAILKMSTLGSPKRGDYARDLSASGPVEIEHALRRAVVMGDRDLASAALARLDNLPKNLRDSVSISRREVGEVLVADEWTRARQFIAMAEIAAESAEIQNRQIEGSDVPSSRKISLGMRRKQLQALLGSSDDPDGPDDDPDIGEPKKKPEKTLEQTLDDKYPGVPGTAEKVLS